VNTWKVLQALGSVVGISVGQLLLKMAAVNLANANATGFWFMGLRINAFLFCGIFVLGASTLLWIWVLRAMPLSVAYPIMALAFVIVPVLSFYLLGEPLTWRLMAGSALIGLGLLTIYS
jgi:drug/metabolite transporter (DMT)-like permease